MQKNMREWVDSLRERYPIGSKIRLNSMDDPYHPVPPEKAYSMLEQMSPFARELTFLVTKALNATCVSRHSTMEVRSG